MWLGNIKPLKNSLSLCHGFLVLQGTISTSYCYIFGVITIFLDVFPTCG